MAEATRKPVYGKYLIFSSSSNNQPRFFAAINHNYDKNHQRFKKKTETNKMEGKSKPTNLFKRTCYLRGPLRLL